MVYGASVVEEGVDAGPAVLGRGGAQRPSGADPHQHGVAGALEERGDPLPQEHLAARRRRVPPSRTIALGTAPPWQGAVGYAAMARSRTRPSTSSTTRSQPTLSMSARSWDTTTRVPR